MDEDFTARDIAATLRAAAEAVERLGARNAELLYALAEALATGTLGEDTRRALGPPFDRRDEPQ